MALSQANLATALDDSFVGTPNLPKYAKDVQVYIKAQYVQSVGDNSSFIHRPFKVVRGVLIFNATDGVLDLAGIQATGLTDATVMWFYELQEIQSGDKTKDIGVPVTFHESELILIAAVETLVGTEVLDWTDAP